MRIFLFIPILLASACTTTKVNTDLFTETYASEQVSAHAVLFVAHNHLIANEILESRFREDLYNMIKSKSYKTTMNPDSASHIIYFSFDKGFPYQEEKIEISTTPATSKTETITKSDGSTEKVSISIPQTQSAQIINSNKQNLYLTLQLRENNPSKRLIWYAESSQSSPLLPTQKLLKQLLENTFRFFSKDSHP